MALKVADNPMVFYTEAGLVKYCDLWADNLRGLLRGLRKVSGSSIFYHLHNALFRRHFTTAEFMNDFARWCLVMLNERVLAERLASVDPLSCASIREAREQSIRYIEEHIGNIESLPRVPQGREFRFCEMKSFIIPTGLRARTLDDFLSCLRRASIGSIFFHFIEARLRLNHPSNDFSEWLSNELGENELADKIRGLSPYNYNLWDLRKAICELVEQRLTHNNV